MTLPRDLPGRYGRVIQDLERMLVATEQPARRGNQPLAIVGVEGFKHRVIEARGGHDRRDAAIEKPIGREPLRQPAQPRNRVWRERGRGHDGGEQNFAREGERGTVRREREGGDAVA